MMEYLTVKETGVKWGLTGRMVNYYCTAGRIEGAVKKGNLWLIPESAMDGRRVISKVNRKHRHRKSE